MSSVGATHHPLRHIKTGAGKAGLTVHIDHAADRAAVHSHSKLSAFFESATNFERAFHWLFRALVENQRHPIARGNLDQPAGLFRDLKFLRGTNNLVKRIEQRSLLVNQQLRVTDDVYEKDVPNFQLNLFFNFGGHLLARIVRNSASYIKQGSKHVIR